MTASDRVGGSEVGHWSVSMGRSASAERSLAGTRFQARVGLDSGQAGIRPRTRGLVAGFHDPDEPAATPKTESQPRVTGKPVASLDLQRSGSVWVDPEAAIAGDVLARGTCSACRLAARDPAWKLHRLPSTLKHGSDPLESLKAQAAVSPRAFSIACRAGSRLVETDARSARPGCH